MDPRNTPGYQMHRALSNLSSIDAAMTLLEQVSLLTRPAATEEANIQIES
ncbi:hypothetical protein [Natrinema sp. CBA1119]|nr:hypothetical protein [Natrinema sp. CBA1119]